jgi:hypothetical protein
MFWNLDTWTIFVINIPDWDTWNYLPYSLMNLLVKVITNLDCEQFGKQEQNCL